MPNATVRANAKAMPIDPHAASGEPLTAEQLAAGNFEPWRHAQGQWTPLEDAEWNRLCEWFLPTLRLAWLTLHRTKAELEKIVADLSDENFIASVKNFAAAAEYAQSTRAIFQGAEARLMVAAASDMRKADPEGFKEA